MALCVSLMSLDFIPESVGSHWSILSAEVGFRNIIKTPCVCLMLDGLLWKVQFVPAGLYFCHNKAWHLPSFTQAGSPEESIGHCDALPASAIRHSSGLSIGDTWRAPGQWSSLWFLWNPGDCLGGEVGRWRPLMLHFDTELTLSGQGRQGWVAEQLLRIKFLWDLIEGLCQEKHIGSSPTIDVSLAAPLLLGEGARHRLQKQRSCAERDCQELGVSLHLSVTCQPWLPVCPAQTWSTFQVPTADVLAGPLCLSLPSHSSSVCHPLELIFQPRLLRP